MSDSALKRLEECLCGLGEILELMAQSYIPVDVVFNDQSR